MTQRSGGDQGSGQASVVVADPEMLVRAGLRSVIEGDPAFRVAAEAETGAHALELVARIHPDLAVVSTSLQDPSGLEVAQRTHETAPATAIVLLAHADDTHFLVDGFRAGAIGFVRSDVGRLELLSTMARARAGESVIDPTAARLLVMRMAAESDHVPPSIPDTLTPRELEILQLVARGQTNREIATRLIVAVGTIKVHVEHILGKLGAADRTQAAVRAVELGIVHVEEPPRSSSHAS